MHANPMDVTGGIPRVELSERISTGARGQVEEFRTQFDGGESSSGYDEIHEFDHPREPGLKIRCPKHIGEYRVVGLIGSGGMGSVFKVVNPFFGFEQALKMIGVKLEDSGDARKQFLEEMKTQAELEHANITRVHYAGTYRGVPEFNKQLYFVMSLEPGDLAEEVKKRGPLAPVESAQIVKQLAGGVGLAHAKQRIHCDLKPKNILIDGKGIPKITDFGLVKLYDETRRQGHSPAEAFGSPSYMPPEQVEGDLARVDARSDVYGLGAILYELLTGRPPFVGKNKHEIFGLVKNMPPESIRAQRPQIPSRLEAICLKCLEKEPAERYQSAAEMERALDVFLRPSWPMRNWKGLGAAAVVFALLAGMAGLARVILLNKWNEQAAVGKKIEDARAKLIADDAELLSHERDPRLEKLNILIADYPKHLDEFKNQSRRDPGGAAYGEPVGFLANAYALRGKLQVELRKYEDAIKDLDEAGKHLPAEAAPADILRARIFHVRGECFAAQQKWEDARGEFQKGLDLRMIRRVDGDAASERALARSYGYLGDTELHLNKLEEAKKSYEHAKSIRAKLAKGDASVENVCLSARDFGNMAEYYKWVGQPEKAEGERRERYKHYQSALANFPVLPGEFKTERIECALGLVESTLDKPSSHRAVPLLLEAEKFLNEAGHELGVLQRSTAREGQSKGADDAQIEPDLFSTKIRISLLKARLASAFDQEQFQLTRTQLVREQLRAAEKYMAALDRSAKAKAEDYYTWSQTLAVGIAVAQSASERLELYVLLQDRLSKATGMSFADRERFVHDRSFDSVRADGILNTRLMEFLANGPLDPNRPPRAAK